jgi:hypothetical protein
MQFVVAKKAAQGQWQLGLEHHQSFFHPFPETDRGVGMTVGLEPALQLAAGGCRARRAIMPGLLARTGDAAARRGRGGCVVCAVGSAG